MTNSNMKQFKGVEVQLYVVALHLNLINLRKNRLQVKHCHPTLK